MRTEAEFRTFYRQTLLAQIQPLEEKRLAVRNRALQVFGGGFGVACIATAVLPGLFDCDAMSVFWVALVIAGVIAGIIYYAAAKEYTGLFKQAIIAPLVKFFGEDLSYQPTGCIPESDFRASGLFEHRIDRYRGEDCVRGTIDKTAFRFSEVHAEYKTQHHGKNGSRTEWHTIFKGVYFIADFNKDFTHRTIVVPDTAEKMLGAWLGNMMQKASTTFSGMELIKLEDPDFEREFAVYGSDQVEARYLLSTSLMERIMNYRRRTGKTMWLSFRNSQIYLALETQKDMFEPNVWNTILEESIYVEFYHDMALILSIIDELNLNLRIWTKQ